jgi:hypothetical protein
MNAVMQESPKDAARRLAAGALRDGFKPDGLHEYCNADGTPIYWRIRLKRADGEKWIRPMHWTGTSYAIGEPPAPPQGKPLYGLDSLPADPAAVVYVVEGEGCADALHKLKLPAITSGSYTSADAADWTPLHGRSCVVAWPDHDKPGMEYAQTVLRKVPGTRLIHPDIVTALPEKGDCVDWLALHPDATADDVRALETVLPAQGQGDHRTSEPEPLPSPLPSVPAFNADLLPDAVRMWCEDAADGLQVPLDFTGIPAMVALAGTIGRSIGIAMKRRNQWIERPMLWGCVVGRPSSGKSPALAPARRMLDRLAGEERQVYEAAQHEYEARAMVADAGKANAKKAIQAALKKGDTSAAQSAAESAAFDDEPPSEPRIVVNDGTMEKIGELLNANPRGLVQFRDELAGWLASLDREGREGDRAFWLECWNGTGSFTTDRIGRGTVRIEACAMSILGGMQPGKLGEYVRGAVRGGFADDGLIQRFQLAVYPDLPSTWTYTDRAPDATAERQAWETFKRLRNLDPDSIGAERAEWCDVPFLRFDDEAQELFVEWFSAHMTHLRTGEEPAWMESHLAKYPGLVGRLALVLHLADGHTGTVAADTLARALNWCEYLTGHARRIYAPATDSGLTGAHLILKRRADIGDTFTARDIYRRGWAGLADAETVEAALDVLVEYRHLTTVPAEPGAMGGRPSVTYAWTAA